MLSDSEARVGEVTTTGKDWDSLAADYDAKRGGDTLATRIVDQILPLLGDVDQIFELVGTGLIARALDQRGRTVIGAHLSSEMLVQARARQLDTLVRADGTQLPIRARSNRSATAWKRASWNGVVKPTCRYYPSTSEEAQARTRTDPTRRSRSVAGVVQ